MSRHFFQQRSDYHLLDDSDDVLLDEIAELDSDSGEPDIDFLRDQSNQSTCSGLVQRIFIACKCFSLGVQLRLSPNKRRVLDTVLSLFCLLTVTSVCLSLGYYAVLVRKPELVIDKSYRAFRIPNHEASLNFGALQKAKTHYTPFRKLRYDLLEKWAFSFGGSSTKHKMSEYRSPSKIIGGQSGHTGRRRLKRSNSIVEVPSQYYPLWKMQVVFLVEENENILTRERLQAVHDIEKKIMRHANFPDFCYKDVHPSILEDPAVKSYNGCAPLNSLLTYFYPSTDNRGNVFYDGLGDNMDNIESALKLAMTSTHFYYYVDDKINSSNLQSRLLRTEVLFGAPLKGYTLNNNRDEQSQKFKDFVITYIDLLSQSSTGDISVLYGGQEIFDFEVESTFWSDIKLALYAVLVIFMLMLGLTSGSLWLTFWGLTSILLSAPLAIFFYRVVFNVRALGILNGAAAFVIIGIGVDDVFVFINVFRQADHLKDSRARTLYTIKTAGKATFFTSFTTAAAFAANIASMIPAVHDFGLFMALIVANCWITVMLIMPPVLYIWYISFANCEAKIGRFICACLPSTRMRSCLQIPEDIAHFMDSSRGSVSHVTLSREVTEEDADVPMLSMDIPGTQYIGDTDDDESLVRIDPDPLVIPDEFESEDKRNSHFGARLQGLMYYTMVVPFVKGRWIIIGISSVLFCMSVGFMTQLHTSTKPPRFFKEYTNIQRLLDLKAKFSTIDNIHCFDCSAIYNLGKVTPNTFPDVTEPTPVKTTQKPEKHCPHGYFPCDFEYCCLPNIKYCDGIPDCKHGTDEPWYCRNSSIDYSGGACLAANHEPIKTTSKPGLTTTSLSLVSISSTGASVNTSSGQATENQSKNSSSFDTRENQSMNSSSFDTAENQSMNSSSFDTTENQSKNFTSLNTTKDQSNNITSFNTTENQSKNFTTINAVEKQSDNITSFNATHTTSKLFNTTVHREPVKQVNQTTQRKPVKTIDTIAPYINSSLASTTTIHRIVNQSIIRTNKPFKHYSTLKPVKTTYSFKSANFNKSSKPTYFTSDKKLSSYITKSIFSTSRPVTSITRALMSKADKSHQKSKNSIKPSPSLNREHWKKNTHKKMNVPKTIQPKAKTSSATSSLKPQSVPENYDVCKNRDCTHLKDRPLLESGATIYVLFGVKNFQWTQQDLGHVMSDDTGTIEFDPRFSSLFNFSSSDILKGFRDLCRVCKKIANNTDLVRNGSAQCLPTDSIPTYIREILLGSVKECQNLPKVTYIYGSEQPAHALGSLTEDATGILWLGFAFESTTSKGKSYFEAYDEYKKWDSFLADLKKEMDPSSPLIDLFQASEFWPEVLMEVVAVNSAIYGVALSLIICMMAVMIFTGHVMLLIIIFVCIIEMVCLVVAIFYVLGWEIGGVEAISLSILVGSSVDYCVHLVEGYVLASQACPHKEEALKARKWRTSAAFTHIGVSIISSALTTIIAAIPLTQTTIQPFAKFGEIIAINTSVCIIYSLTVCTALLSTFAPAFFKSSWVSTLKSLGGTILVVGVVILGMFIASKAGVEIPGPNGNVLFKN